MARGFVANLTTPAFLVDQAGVLVFFNEAAGELLGVQFEEAGPIAAEGPIHILLTHLHLDHIQGLLFFSPLFQAGAEITIWGPAAGRVPLRNRIGRYLSAPLTPVEVRELPCQLDFRNCPVSEWDIGPARIRAEAVTH